MLHDLLVRRVHAENAWRAANPKEAALADALVNPKVQAGLKALHAAANDPAAAARFLAKLNGPRPPPAPTRVVVSAVQKKAVSP